MRNTHPQPAARPLPTYAIKTVVFLCVLFLGSCASLLLEFILKWLYPEEFGLIKGNKNDLEITYHEVLFFFTLVFACFVLAFTVGYVRQRVVKYSLQTLAAVYLFTAALVIVLDCMNYMVFGSRLNFSSVQTVINTNTDEFSDFVHAYVTPLRLLPLLFLTIGCAAAIWQRHRLKRLFAARTFLLITLGLSAVGAIDFIQTSHAKGNGLHNVRYWDITVGEYNEYREFNRRLANEKNSVSQSEQYLAFRQSDTSAKTLVLLISESLSRRHMSLYGYSRPTTPGLDSNSSVYKFTDCVTSAALTTDAVPALFTQGYLENRINLISLFKRLGYETSWISNQAGWGRGDKSIVLLSQLCDHTVFTDRRGDDEKANVSRHYDEELIPYVEAVLKGGARRKFIVVHFMGCHFDYEKRYPATRAFFSGRPPQSPFADNARSQEIVNAYDNAMRYHDSVVTELTRVFEKQCADEPATLVFLSDHGEELFDYRRHFGHGYPANRASAEIPFFMLLSRALKKQQPELDSMIRSRRDLPWSSNDAFFTLLQLQGVRSERYEKPLAERALFSSRYSAQRVREVMGDDYSKMK